MLRECREHGFFRGESCPICDEEGKFLMNEKELEKLGKVMAGILRHFPEKFNLEMSRNGWVNIYAFVSAVRGRRDFKWLRTHHIKAVVETDPKGRYQIEQNNIRATYGHSIDVELDLPTDNIPNELFYPTTEDEAEIVLETGIKPVDRKMVHLSKSKKDAEIAGLHRSEKPIILTVDAEKAIKDGKVIKRAGKTVYITSDVESKYLSVK